MSDGTTWNTCTDKLQPKRPMEPSTQLEVMFPDGITRHLPQEAKGSLNRASMMKSVRRRRRQKRQLHDQGRDGDRRVRRRG